jgi:hypothetical protein
VVTGRTGERRMRDLSSSAWVIPRFLGKRVMKGTLTRWLVFGKVAQNAVDKDAKVMS